MSAFTDRLVAAGVDPGIATDIEVDLYTDLTKAKAERARLAASIDTLQTEIDALKAQRQTQTTIIASIRTTLGDPNA